MWPDFKCQPINLLSKPQQLIDYDYDADIADSIYLISKHERDKCIALKVANCHHFEISRLDERIKRLTIAQREMAFINFCRTGKMQ